MIEEVDVKNRTTYFCLLNLSKLEVISFVYKALLAISLDDDKRRSHLIMTELKIGEIIFTKDRTIDMNYT